MAEVTSALVKELREKSGAGMMDCKKALQECAGDLGKASDWLREKGLATAGGEADGAGAPGNPSDWLREKGLATAGKKAGRSATEGMVGHYIHMGGKIGVLVEVNCETDFTARNEKFQQLVKDIAMQIAAMSPEWVRREEVPADALEHEKKINRAQLLEQGKPEAMLEKILPGKLEKFF